MMARTVVSATSSSPRRCSPRTRTALCVEEASHGRVEGWAKQRAWQGGGKRPRLARRVGGGRAAVISASPLVVEEGSNAQG
jgi:hypothetical protein